MKKLQQWAALWIVLMGTFAPVLSLLPSPAYASEVGAVEQPLETGNLPVVAENSQDVDQPVVIPAEEETGDETNGGQNADTEAAPAEEQPVADSPVLDAEVAVPMLGDPSPDDSSVTMNIEYDVQTKDVGTVAGTAGGYYIGLGTSGIDFKNPKMTLTMSKAIFEEPTIANFTGSKHSQVEKYNVVNDEDKPNYEVEIYFKEEGLKNVSIPFSFTVKTGSVINQEEIIINQTYTATNVPAVTKENKFSVKTTTGTIYCDTSIPDSFFNPSQVVDKADGMYLNSKYEMEWTIIFYPGTDKRDTVLQVEIENDSRVSDKTTKDFEIKNISGHRYIEWRIPQNVKQIFPGRAYFYVSLTNDNWKMGTQLVRNVRSAVVNDNSEFDFDAVGSMKYTMRRNLKYQPYTFDIANGMSSSIEGSYNQGNIISNELFSPYLLNEVEEEETSSFIRLHVNNTDKAVTVPLTAMGEEFVKSWISTSSRPVTLKKYRLTVTNYVEIKGTIMENNLPEEEIEKIKHNKLIGITSLGKETIIAENIPINLNGKDVDTGKPNGEFGEVDLKEEYTKIELRFDEVVTVGGGNRFTGGDAIYLELVTQPGEAVKKELAEKISVENYKNKVIKNETLSESYFQNFYVTYGFGETNKKGQARTYQVNTAQYKNYYTPFMKKMDGTDGKVGAKVKEVGADEQFVIKDVKHPVKAKRWTEKETGTYMFLIPENIDFMGFEPSAAVKYSNTRVVYNYKEGKTAVFSDVEIDNNDVEENLAGDFDDPNSSLNPRPEYIFSFRPILHVSKYAKNETVSFESYFIWKDNEISVTDFITPMGGVKDLEDIDKDGDVEELCLNQKLGIPIKPNKQFGIISKVDKTEGGGRYSPGVRADEGDTVKIKIELNNQTDNKVEKLSILDILPYKDDYTFLDNVNDLNKSEDEKERKRGSTFDALLQGPLKILSAGGEGYLYYYSFYSRANITKGTTLAEVMEKAEWLSEAEVGGKWSDVTMIRIVMKDGTALDGQSVMEFEYELELPENLKKDDRLVNTIVGINNLNYKDGYSESEFSTVDIARYELSGTVYLDTEAGKRVLAGHTVALKDSNGNEVATTTTKEDGSYIFDDQDKLVKQGNYTVECKFGVQTVSGSVTFTSSDDKKMLDLDLVPEGEPQTLTVKYRDTKGNAIPGGPEDIAEGRKYYQGEIVEVTLEPIEGYKPKSINGKAISEDDIEKELTKFEFDGEVKEIVVVYAVQGEITVKHLKENGDELYGTEVKMEAAGESYLISPLPADNSEYNPNYRPINAKVTDTETGIEVDDDDAPKLATNLLRAKSSSLNYEGEYKDDKNYTVTYTYENFGKVEVKYQDTKDNELSESVILDGKVGAEYVTEKLAISGYKFKEVKDGKATGKIVEGTTTVIYVYEVDDQSQQKPDPSPDYKHVYVKYVDESGKEIAVSAVLTGEIGDSYQATAKVIAGYELIGLATNSDAESGVFGNSVKTVVYTYKKKAGTPEIPMNPTDPNNPTNPETPTDPVNPTNPETPTNPGNVTPTPTPENNGSDKADGNGEKNESGAGNAKVTGNVKNATTKNKNDLPKTGEANNTVLWFIGVVCIALTFIFFQKYRGKNDVK